MIKLFGEVVSLLGRSDLHQKWTVADVGRLIGPPLLHGQFVELRDREKLIGFASYALLTEEAAQGYIDRTRKLQPGDWKAGENIWNIDTIAPFGHGTELARKLRDTLLDKGFKGRKVRFIRTMKDKRRVSGVEL